MSLNLHFDLWSDRFKFKSNKSKKSILISGQTNLNQDLISFNQNFYFKQYNLTFRSDDHLIDLITQI